MTVRKTVRIVAVICLQLAVILVCLEISTRLVRPQSVFSATVNTWDERLGTRHIPGARGFVSGDEYEIELVINSKGLRDREFEYENPDGARRILSLGDSFACGYGVPADSTYAKVLERLLAERPVSWQVLNAGVGSTGTAHQLAYFLDDGCRYQPDIVIVGFFTGNDFWDNVLCGLYTLEDDRLLRNPVRRTRARSLERLTKWVPGYGFLLRHSHFIALLRHEVAFWHRKQLTDTAFSDERVVRDGLPARLAERLLARLDERCAQTGSALVVMLIPPAGPARAPDLEREATLAEFLDSEGIPCLDLGPIFRGDRARRYLYFSFDAHWTARGHRLAAGELARFLDEHGLLEAAEAQADAPSHKYPS